MKLNVLGVKRIAGTNKAGNDFDMCHLYGIVPIQTGGSAAVKITGYGLEVAEMPLAPEAMASFASLKFPVNLELDTDVRPYMGKLETFVVGFVPPSPSVKAA